MPTESAEQGIIRMLFKFMRRFDRQSHLWLIFRDSIKHYLRLGRKVKPSPSLSEVVPHLRRAIKKVRRQNYKKALKESRRDTVDHEFEQNK